MKYECPICHAELEHERVDDGFITHSISKSGKVKEIANDSNGHDRVYCTEHSDHEIPDELYNKILDLVQ